MVEALPAISFSLVGSPAQGLQASASDLNKCDFTGADLRGADLRDANLLECRFIRARLGNARFFGAKTFNTDFRGADLRGAREMSAEQLMRARTDDTTVLPNGTMGSVPQRLLRGEARFGLNVVVTERSACRPLRVPISNFVQSNCVGFPGT
ncbi:MAG: pentapeptide repeat-containing protein [Verrucomicrobiota bacterium]